MKRIPRKFLLFSLILMMLVPVGCRQHTMDPSLKSKFERNVDQLVLDTAYSLRQKGYDIAPAAVVSGNALRNQTYTRLDEMIITRLRDRLAENREVISLSRENWFELKEKRPVSFKGHDRNREPLLENLVILVVNIKPEPNFDRIRVQVTAKNAKSLPLPGVGGKVMLEHFDDSPGTVLLKTQVDTKPYPEGLKSNPYISLEQMAYSMASELSYAVDRGIKTGRHKAAKDEIRVVVCTQKAKGPGARFQKAFTRELSQSLAAMDGMTSSVSRKDFSPIFRQMDFYQKNDHVFDIGKEKLAPGTVLLLVETKHQGSLEQVALRAVWRITPLMNARNQLIVSNSAGSYVSGFTSRAWYNGRVPVVQDIPDVRPKKPHSIFHKKRMEDRGFD